jgi:hypothetical protein
MRTTRAKRLTCAALCALAAAALAPDGWARDAGLDFWNLPADRAALDAAAVTSEELEHRVGAAVASYEARHALVDDLIAGRACLADVAAEFAEMNGAIPGRPELVRGLYPSPSDDGCAALQVIHFVGVRAHRRQADASEALPRLEAEYRARWGAGAVTAAPAPDRR